MRILVTGGSGYVGSRLTKHLLDQGHDVVVWDAFWFGNHLPQSNRLKVIEGDIRNIDQVELPPCETIIHLANVANDPAAELNKYMSWEVNVLATMRLMERAARTGVKKFIYASSGSVYGVKEEDRVTEDLEPYPISEYNRTKMVCDRVVISYADKMSVYAVRPATICGLSPRQRLDLAVNMLTFQALSRQKITVFGGTQIRPNIHIDDMIGVYDLFVGRNDIPSGIYNAGFENISILEIANTIKTQISAEVTVESSNDPRSYRLDSSKLLKLGFKPKKTVRDAIDELKAAFDRGELVDHPSSHSVKWMKERGIV